MNYLRISCILIAFSACSKATADDCKNSHQAKRVEEIARQADERMIGAMKAGLAESERRMIAAHTTVEQAVAEGILPAPKDIPTEPRLPDGTLHPIVKKYAIDGDGRLRGEGPGMEEMQMQMKLAVQALERAKEDGCR